MFSQLMSFRSVRMNKDVWFVLGARLVTEVPTSGTGEEEENLQSLQGEKLHQNHPAAEPSSLRQHEYQNHKTTYY